MIDITPDTLAAIGETVRRENERSESHRRAQTVIELATLSLLIERNLLTVEDVASRIAEIHSALPETFREPLVLQQTDLAVQTLRQAHGAKRPRWTPEIIRGGRDQKADDQPPPPSSSNDQS